MNKAQLKKVFWMCFTLVLSVLTVYTLLKQTESLSLDAWVAKLSNADGRWIAIAVICSISYVLLEAIALCSILRGLGHKRKLRKGILYSTADVYFSAITPSATGGQPASAFFMLKDDIPAGVASAALILNLMMYNASIIFLGLIAIIISPRSFLDFHLAAKVFIGLGFIGLSLLAVFFFMVLKNSSKIFEIVRKILEFLHRKKIIHRLEHKLERLDKIENDYKNCAEVMAGKTRIIIYSFIWNVLQRASQIVVPALLYIATGGKAEEILELFSKQCLITIGYNYVPIPGALGIADYLMIDGFSSIMSKTAAIDLDMLSRGLTFYICVTLSGLVTLVGYLRGRKKK